MFRWPVALEPIVQDSDGRLGAFDELAERVAVEDEQPGDVVAQVVRARLLADAAHFVRVGRRHLADVEEGEKRRRIARVGTGVVSVHRSHRRRAAGSGADKFDDNAKHDEPA